LIRRIERNCILEWQILANLFISEKIIRTCTAPIVSHKDHIRQGSTLLSYKVGGKGLVRYFSEEVGTNNTSYLQYKYLALLVESPSL